MKAFLLKTKVSCYCLLLKAAETTMIRGEEMFKSTRSRNRRKVCGRQCVEGGTGQISGEKFHILYIEKYT